LLKICYVYEVTIVRLRKNTHVPKTTQKCLNILHFVCRIFIRTHCGWRFQKSLDADRRKWCWALHCRWNIFKRLKGEITVLMLCKYIIILNKNRGEFIFDFCRSFYVFTVYMCIHTEVQWMNTCVVHIFHS